MAEGAIAQTKIYSSASGEMIFSFANITRNGNKVDSKLRWSPVFNLQGLVNYDFNNHFGFFHGLTMRNVGFTYDQSADTMKKFRTYNVGIPLGIKLGNLEKGLFIYGGYEFEMPFHYKEKTFINEDKTDKISVYFSNRVNWYTQSLFVGLNFPGGYNLKFKYYINEFFNKNYTESTSGVQVKPFENFNAHVFYIALDYNVFKDVKDYGKQKAKPQQKEDRYSYNYK
jgi:hypothetical protein